jgi:hypothetical protein
MFGDRPSLQTVQLTLAVNSVQEIEFRHRFVHFFWNRLRRSHHFTYSLFGLEVMHNVTTVYNVWPGRFHSRHKSYISHCFPNYTSFDSQNILNLMSDLSLPSRVARAENLNEATVII